MSIKSAFCAAYFICTFFSANTTVGTSSNQINLTQMSENIVGSQPHVEQSSSRGVVILNAPDRTLHVVRDGKLIKSFGSFGTGPGELYSPVIAANSNYIVDVEPFTQRVQWFTADGTYRHTCHISTSLDTRAAALTNDDMLLLNDSHGPNPIVLMNQECKIIKRFGLRLKVSDLYGTSNTSRDFFI
jgi:hypothetical protein